MTEIDCNGSIGRESNFRVLELVRTSFDVGVGPKSNEMRRSVQFAHRFETTSTPKFRTTSFWIEIRRERNPTFRQNPNSDIKTKLSICRRKIRQRPQTTSKLNSASKISLKTFFLPSLA